MKRIDPELLKNNIEKRLADDMKNSFVGGGSILVKQDGEVLYRKCFGVRSVASAEAVGEDTIYRLASMTKPICTVAALILVDRGLIALDDRIDKYLPEFGELYVEENGALEPMRGAVRIRNLLTHTSGIGNAAAVGHPAMTDVDCRSVSSFAQFISKRPAGFEPDAREAYSGVDAFSVMGAIIERVSGRALNEFFREEIFEPCEMHDATFEPTDAQRARIIAMHNMIDGKSVDVDMPDGCVFECYPYKTYLGGAGLAATLSDYEHFADMLLAEGAFNGRRIISEQAILEMRKPYICKEDPANGEFWGLGVRLVTDECYRRLPVGSFGWSGAYGTHFWVDPENKIVAVYMKNSRYDGGSGAKTSSNLEIDVYKSIC